MEILSKSASKVQQELSKKGVDFKVVELSASTRTAIEAAQAIGCEVAQIVKSLLFKTESDKPILLLVSGINRVDEKKIEQVIGQKITKADADFTREMTGFAIGGIPPLGHTNKIDTFIDQDLLKYSQVWAAAGTPHAVFNLNSNRLAELTDGKIISIK